jgi:hypothetical protein
MALAALAHLDSDQKDVIQSAHLIAIRLIRSGLSRDHNTAAQLALVPFCLPVCLPVHNEPFSSQPGREIAPAVRRFDLPLGFVLDFVRANTSQKDRSHKRNFENQMTVTMINLPLISTTHFTLSPSTAFPKIVYRQCCMGFECSMILP